MSSQALTRRIEITNKGATFLPEIRCRTVAIKNMHQHDTTFYVGDKLHMPFNGSGFELRHEESMIIHLYDEQDPGKQIMNSSDLAVSTNKDSAEIVVTFI